MSKKGVSLDEKRERILAIFHETKDVYQLKDIEKIGTKKGVVTQSIKDVLQSLVDDGMVHQEKIGSSNYFWSFPSEAAVKLTNEERSLTQKLDAKRGEREALQAQLNTHTAGKENSEARQLLSREHQQLKADVADKQTELEQYSENNPERYASLLNACYVARDSANRWIDNLDLLRTWAKNKYPDQGEALDGFFKENGYKGDLDPIEWEP